MRKVLLIVIAILILAGCTQEQETETLNAKTSKGVEFGIQTKAPLELKEEEVTEDGKVIVNNPHAIDVVVNKERRLPEGYEPKNLVEPNVPLNAPAGDQKRQMREEAAKALEELFEAAEDAGYTLVAQSGYRSVERQSVIYNNNIATKGQEWTDQYSAAPGHSEHNTGLAMDITIPLETGGFLGLEEALGETEPGQWVADHAHEFGFVIRYPEGKSDITGYNYEPWHLRYFGVELATNIYESGLTVEEYFGYVD